MHEEEASELLRPSQVRKEYQIDKAIFLGQECRINKRRIRFEKTCTTYDIKGRKCQEDVDMSCHSGSGNRSKTSSRKQFNFTKSEIEYRLAKIKLEDRPLKDNEVDC
jgi:hypothetical protein